MLYKGVWRISIRLKIVALTVSLLAVTLLSYLYVSRTLIVSDKVSYVYSQGFAQLKVVAEGIESRLQRLHSVAGILVRLSQTNDAKRFYEEESKKLGIHALSVLRPVNDKSFSIVKSYGEDEAHGAAILALSAWSPSTFNQSASLVTRLASGRFLVGGRGRDSAGAGLAYVIAIDIDPALLGKEGEFEAHLVDSAGRTLLSRDGSEIDQSDAVLNFQKSVAVGGFSSGAREWTHPSGREYLISYQRIASDQLLLISYTEREIAYSAVKTLIQRSFVLGIGMLFLAISVSLLVVRQLTARLRQIWLATQKVSQGDFSFRVALRGRSVDEVTDLATSLNVMSEKIADLMEQTAIKARLEKELETAHIVQSMFIPSAPFQNAQISLSGQSVAATECAGDWWQYAQVGDHLLLVVGDVTGHGVSAALVTAAAHGAFAPLIRQFRQTPSTAPSLEMLFEHLNEAVLASGGGRSWMTCLGFAFDLKNGKLRMINASHLVPYLYRKGPGSGNQVGLERIRGLTLGKCVPLGQAERVTFDVHEEDIQPGDQLFMCTDGLLECEDTDGRRLSKTRLLKYFAMLSEQHGSNPQLVCNAVMDHFMSFLGEASKERADDVTAVVVSIPESVVFDRKPQAAA